MRRARQSAALVLLALVAAALLAGVLAPAPYAHQDRERPAASPSRQSPLGTDELGRDRLSRLLYGSRVSLLLAPAAALVATLGAALIGGLAGYLGGRWESFAMGATDLFLSLPWLFLLLTVRALLPLNVPPWQSVAITFLLLGLLGWAAPARVVRARVRSLARSDFLLHARASGCRGLRLLVVHVLPNLKSVLAAQFWISVPVFVLAEANLGLLGLGVAEPLPSWGNLLRELGGDPQALGAPWRLAPAILLVVAMSAMQLLLPKEETIDET